MSRSRHEPLFALVAAAAVVMAGCVSPHKPGVRIESLDADIVFGLATPATPPSPPGVPQFTPQTPQPPSQSGPPDIILPTLPPFQAPKAGAPVVHPCPTARQGVFPAAIATDSVSSTPTPGVYKWRPGPPQLFGQDFFNIPDPSKFIYREITNVSPITHSTGVDASGTVPTTSDIQTFTYEVVTIFPDHSSTKDTFQVEQHATKVSVIENAGPSLRAGDPARGVSLIKHVEYDAAGMQGATFVPPASSPLLLLPLSVTPSEQFQSESSDPTSGSSYTLTGTVSKRATVDACGDEVDGWQVDAQTSFTYAVPRAAADGGDAVVTQTANYTYFIATQLGGILTYEKVEPLNSIPTPPTGTPADPLVPGSNAVPANPVPAKPYEIGIGSLTPLPLVKSP